MPTIAELREQFPDQPDDILQFALEENAQRLQGDRSKESSIRGQALDVAPEDDPYGNELARRLDAGQPVRGGAARGKVNPFTLALGKSESGSRKGVNPFTIALSIFDGEDLSTPQPEEPQRGTLAEIGRQAWGGLVTRAPKMINQAAQAFSPAGSDTEEFFKNNAEFWGAREKAYEPDLAGRGEVSKALIEGAGQIAPSLIGMAATAVNPVVGGAVVASTFGGQQFTESYEKALAAGRSRDEAFEVGLKTGGIEGFGETIGDLMGGKFLKGGATLIQKAFGPKGLEEAVKLASDPAWAKRFATAAAGNAVVQSGTEFGQGYGETAVEKAHGLTTADPLEEGIHGAKVALGMSALMLPLGAPGHYHAGQQREAAAKVIDDPTAPPELRQKAADILQAEISNYAGTDKASAWRQEINTKFITEAKSADEALATFNAATDINATGDSDLTAIAGLHADLLTAERQRLDSGQIALDAEIDQGNPNAVAQPVVSPSLAQTNDTIIKNTLTTEDLTGTTADTARLPDLSQPVPTKDLGARALEVFQSGAEETPAGKLTLAYARRDLGEDQVEAIRKRAVASALMTREEQKAVDAGVTRPIQITQNDNGVPIVRMSTPEIAAQVAQALKDADVRIHTIDGTTIRVPAAQKDVAQNVVDRMNTRFSPAREDLTNQTFPDVQETASGTTSTQTISQQAGQQAAPATQPASLTLGNPKTTQAATVRTMLSDKVTAADQVGVVENIDALPDQVTANAGKRVSKQMARWIRMMAGMLNRKVVFYETTAEKAPEGINQDGNTIYINVDSDVDTVAIAGHEFVHSLEHEQPELYRQLLDAAKQVMRKGGLKKAQEYANYSGTRGEGFDAIARELLSDFGGNEWRDGALWSEVFEQVRESHPPTEARSIIAKLRDAIVAFINKLIRATPKQGFQHGYSREELVGIREMLVKAAAESFRRAERVSLGMEAVPAGKGEVRFSQRPADFTDPEERKTVSTTVPKPSEKKGRANNPITEKWVIDTEDMRAGKNHLTAAINAISQYNTVIADPSQGEEVLAELRKVVVDNLLKLHDMMPENIRERAKLWYDGANRIANDWAALYGISDRQAAGALAVFSPQMDWFKNVSLAERAITIAVEHRNDSWDSNMTAWVKSYVEAAATLKDREDRLRLLEDAKRLEGKPMRYMKLSDQARFVRAFDETYFERNYHLITPEGGFGDYVTKMEDDEGNADAASVTWGSFATIEKGLSILYDGSFKNISERLGNEHKVRNFYNNIIDPNSVDGHVTIDTHAIAAATFKALSGSAVEVSHNFGTTPKGKEGAGQTAETGASGTYGLFADAYREAASMRNLLAREMQSITWEAVRSLFPAGQKKQMQPKIEKIWDKFKAGEIDRAEAERQVMALSGGLRPMQWEGAPEGQFASNGGTSFNHTKAQPRSLAPANTKEKVTVSMSAYTDSIPALRQLRNMAAKGDMQAHALLQKVALDAAKEIMRGTSAKITAENATGLYGGAVEPSLSVTMSFNHAERNEIISRLKVFADTFNQEQVHVLRAVKEKPGHQYADGSYATVVYRWELNQSLSAKEIAKIIKSANLYGLTFGDTFITAYYVGDPTDTGAINEFENKIHAADVAIGSRSVANRREVARLWAYGDRGDGAIGWPGVSGDVSGEQGVRAESVRVAKQYIAESKRPDAAGSGQLRAGAEGTVRQSQSRPGAVSATGIHYSREQRETLSSYYFGTGINSAELERVKQATDPRIKQRIYFYVNTGRGINPESGVGAHAHQAALDNLYDLNADSRDLLARYAGDANALESAILDAGFDGTLNQDRGIAVLIGPRSVPVEYKGTGRKEVPLAEKAQRSAYGAARDAIAARRDLPAGQLSGAAWKAKLPEMDLSHLEDGKDYFKGDLVQKPRFSQPRDVDRYRTLRAMWLKLADSDSLFQFPKSEGDTLQGVMKDIDPGFKVSERYIVPDRMKSTQTVKWWKLTSPDGKDIEVQENAQGEIWVNASHLTSGKSGGVKLYAGLLNYAYNAGKVFIGDPHGVSDIAIFRRTENMLASALKFGTTEHMRPANEQSHPMQYRDTLGHNNQVLEKLAPVEWDEGNDARNLSNLLKASYDNVKAFVPEIEHVTYNFDREQFEWAGDTSPDATRSLWRGMPGGEKFGQPHTEITRDEWKVLSERLRQGLLGRGGPERLSDPMLPVQSGEDKRVTTLERAALSNTVLREQSEAGLRSVLAKTGEELRLGLDGVSYSKQRAVDTSSPAFNRWFNGSAVINKDGTPLRVYHDTNTDFTEFKDSDRSRSLWGGSLGWHFGTAEAANERSESLRGMSEQVKRDEPPHRVLPVYLSIKNPLRLQDMAGLTESYEDDEGFETEHAKQWENPDDVAEVLLDREIIDIDEFEDSRGDFGKIKEVLRAKGYDGIVYRNVVEDAGSDSWIAFFPEQIKSAVSNAGEFKGSDIRYSTPRIIGDSGRPYDPAQRALFKNVGREIDQLNTLEKLKKWSSQKWVQGLVDQFRPVRDISAKGYTLMRLSKGATGAFEAFMQHGKLKLHDGAYDADTSGGVMDKVFYPLGKETTDFLYWIAGNRAERLAAEGKERLFSNADIAAAKSLATGTADFDYTLANGTVTRKRELIYNDSLRKFNEFNKNVMDMAEQSGLIDGASRHLWEHEFYVPFFRVMDDTDGGVRGMNIKKGVVRQEAFKKLKGGKEGLNDLLANTLMNWAHLIDAAAKNRAAKEVLDTAVSMGAARPAISGEKNTVWYSNQGNKAEFKVDDEGLLIALQGLDFAGIRGPMMDILSKPKHWLTVGVTASPFFKIRNLIRDSVQAIGTSELGPNPFANVIKGAKLTDRDRQEYVSALAGGGLIRFGTMLEGSEVARTRQLIKKGAKDAHILDGESKIRAFYDKFLEPGIAAYNELGNRGEEINRMALYDQLIKQGKDHATASLMARDLMDFSMQGSFSSIRFLTQVVPFLNARLQGLYKLGRQATGTKQEQRKMAVTTFTVAMAGLALLGYAASDDDRWKRWKRREQWDVDTYWLFTIGGEDFRIPKPFEIGAVATVAERLVQTSFLDNEQEKWQNFGHALVKIASDQLAMNPTPQAFKPILDVYSNKDSFSKRPIETMAMEKLDPTHRYSASTSMPARYASQAIGGLLSPVQIDHLVRGYFAWMGATSVASVDMLMRAANDEPTRPTMDYWKLATGGMVADSDSAGSKYVSLMYDQAKELEQAYGTWHRLLKEGKTEEAQEYREDNAEKLAKYKSVEGTKRAVAKLNERIRMIERSNMDSDAKRDMIRQIKKQESDLAERLVPTD